MSDLFSYFYKDQFQKFSDPIYSVLVEICEEEYLDRSVGVPAEDICKAVLWSSGPIVQHNTASALLVFKGTKRCFESGRVRLTK